MRIVDHDGLRVPCSRREPFPFGKGPARAPQTLRSSSGAVLLLRTAAISSLAKCLSWAMAPWRTSRGVHDPGKTLLDRAIAIALGGDCLADVAVLRAQPELFGREPRIRR
jgi:hypothetical protein